MVKRMKRQLVYLKTKNGGSKNEKKRESVLNKLFIDHMFSMIYIS